jgi:hypothetical protein
MPGRRKDLVLVLVDKDKGTFDVLGPMFDDTSWNKRVVEAQHKGRRISCFSGNPSRTLEDIAKEYARQTGYTYTESPIL